MYDRLTNGVRTNSPNVEATCYPCHDRNGNISNYVDSNGVVVAHREYDPFGDTVNATDSMVDDFCLWFSAKCLDAETGLYYYGYRYYSPTLGKWVSRDPIGGKGFGLSRKYESHVTGKNGHKKRTPHWKNYSEDYLFVRNSPVSKMDSIGLFIDDIYVDIGLWPPSIDIGAGMSWRECKAPKVWMRKPAARPPEVNGCNFPWLLQWMLESDDNDPNNPSGYANITAACNSHDKCYDNCSSEKGQCDKDLRRDMVEACMLQAGDNYDDCVWWARFNAFREFRWI